MKRSPKPSPTRAPVVVEIRELLAIITDNYEDAIIAGEDSPCVDEARAAVVALLALTRDFDGAMVERPRPALTSTK